MNKLFRFHNLLALVLLLALFAVPMLVQAQEPSPSADVLATLGFPPMLLFLIGVNNRGTQFIKLWLAAPKLPLNFSPDVQRVIVSVSSFAIGLIAAVFVPDALSWLPLRFQTYPIAAVFLVAIASSFGGALAQYVLDILSSASKMLAASNQSVYKSTTEISSLPTDASAPKETMTAVSQAVKS